MHVPHVDHPCEEFLDRRPCFAVAQIPCGKQVRQAWLDRVRRIGSQVFRNVLLCSAASRQSTSTTTEAGPALRRSHWSAPVRRRAPPRLFRDAGRAQRTPEPATIGRAQCRLHRTRQIERLASAMAGASHAGSQHKLPIRWRQVVEPALYTVEGRQAGDLPPRCGTALIRHQTRKTWQPHDDCD
jgi:hypothetical protein